MVRKRGTAERRAMFYNINHRSTNDGRISKKVFENQNSTHHRNDVIYTHLEPQRISDFRIKREIAPPTNNILKNFAKESLIGTAAVGASIATASPIPLMLWKGYKTYNTIDKIVKIAEENHLDVQVKEIGSMMASSIGGSILNPKIDNVSKKLADLFVASNISQLGTAFSIEPNLMNEMFQNTIKNALETGWDNIPTLVSTL